MLKSAGEKSGNYTRAEKLGAPISCPFFLSLSAANDFRQGFFFYFGKVTKASEFVVVVILPPP